VHPYHAGRPGPARWRRDTPTIEANSAARTRTSRVIKASRDALYHAFTDPAALAVWLSPGEMIGKVHAFDARVGGGYRVSGLFTRPLESVHEGGVTTSVVRKAFYKPLMSQSFKDDVRIVYRDLERDTYTRLSLNIYLTRRLFL
jgi:Activator of Hsp90 ATPase homolog 1-like protein